MLPRDFTRRRTSSQSSTSSNKSNTPPSETAQIEEYNLKYTLEYKFTF